MSERKCTVAGIDRRGDVLEPQREDARLQVNLADVAHQREIRVVDRDGKIGLILFRGRGGLGLRLLFVEARAAARAFFSLPASGASRTNRRQGGRTKIRALRDGIGCLLRVNIASQVRTLGAGFLAAISTPATGLWRRSPACRLVGRGEIAAVGCGHGRGPRVARRDSDEIASAGGAMVRQFFPSGVSRMIPLRPTSQQVSRLARCRRRSARSCPLHAPGGAGVAGPLDEARVPYPPQHVRIGRMDHTMTRVAAPALPALQLRPAPSRSRRRASACFAFGRRAEREHRTANGCRPASPALPAAAAAGAGSRTIDRLGAADCNRRRFDLWHRSGALAAVARRICACGATAPSSTGIPRPCSCGH